MQSTINNTPRQKHPMLSRLSSFFGSIWSPANPPVDNKDFEARRKIISRMITNKAGTELITITDSGEINFWHIDAKEKQQGRIKLTLAKNKTVKLDHRVIWYAEMQFQQDDLIVATGNQNGGGSVYKIKQNQETDAKLEKIFDYTGPKKLQKISSDATKLLLTEKWCGNNISHAVYTIDNKPQKKVIELKAPHGLTLIDSKLTSNCNEVIAMCADDKGYIGVKTFSLSDEAWDMRGEMVKIQLKIDRIDELRASESNIFSITPDYVLLNIRILKNSRDPCNIFSVWNLASRCQIMQHSHPVFGTLSPEPWSRQLSLSDNPNSFIVDDCDLLWLFELDLNGMRITEIANSNMRRYSVSLPSCFIGNVLLTVQFDQPFTEIHDTARTRNQHVRAALLPLLCRDLLPIVLGYDRLQFFNRKTICLDAPPTEKAQPAPRVGR